MNQLQGHGRRGTSWIKCQNALAFSLLFPFSRTPTLASLKLGNDLCEFIKSNFQVSTQLKWPNDIFFNGKKIGGIIAQLIQAPDHSSWILAGVGINLGLPTEDEIKHLANFNASYLAENISFIGEDEHARSNAIANTIMLSNDSEEKIIEKWKFNCCHLGKTVAILDDDKVISNGTFIGVGYAGQALIKTETKLEEHWSGTLRF